MAEPNSNLPMRQIQFIPLQIAAFGRQEGAISAVARTS